MRFLYVMPRQSRAWAIACTILLTLNTLFVGTVFADDLTWEEGKTTFTYFFQNGTPDIAGDDEHQAVRDALDIWNEVIDVTFTEVDDVSADLIIRWGDVDGDVGETLAVATWNLGFETEIVPTESGGISIVIVGRYMNKCFLTFDELETWSLDEQPNGNQPIDLVSIALHELGHCLGLIDHPEADNEVMSNPYDGTDRDLSPNDIARIQAIHPPRLSSDPTIGTITVAQAGNSTWETVTFDQPFAEPPIVIVSPPSFNVSAPVTVRVRNVTAESFEVQLRGWNYLSDLNRIENLFYMALPEGTHDFGGVQVTAGSVDIRHQWETVSGVFGNSPVVIAQQVTSNGSDTTTVRTRNVSSSQFDLRLQEEEGSANPAHDVETVHYVTMTQGEGSLNQRVLRVGSTGTNVSHQWHEVDLGHDERTEHWTEDFYFFADDQTYLGGNTATVRYKIDDELPLAVDVKIEEEQSKDDEIAHVKEEIGWVAFGIMGITGD